MSHTLSLHVHMPNNQNAAEILSMLAIALEKDKLPPMVNSVKGFMRHMTTVLINEQGSLLAYGQVDDRFIGPVLKNSSDVLGSAMLSATILAMMSGPDIGTVLSSVSCMDDETKRGVFMVMAQHDDDFNPVTMGVKAPQLTYLSSDNLEQALQAEGGLETKLHPWNGRPQELAETMAAYLEAGQLGTVH